MVSTLAKVTYRTKFILLTLEVIVQQGGEVEGHVTAAVRNWKVMLRLSSLRPFCRRQNFNLGNGAAHTG